MVDDVLGSQANLLKASSRLIGFVPKQIRELPARENEWSSITVSFFYASTEALIWDATSFSYTPHCVPALSSFEPIVFGVSLFALRV